MIQEMQIWIAIIQQSNGERKRRPVVMLKKMPNNDYLVSAISSQLRQEIQGFDVLLLANNLNGLNTNSLVRLYHISTLAENELFGMIGTITSEQHNTLLERISNYLRKDLV